MHIKTEIDVSQVVKLTKTVLRQLPYALNNAITETAKLVVAAGQFEIRRDLTIRKGDFLPSRFRMLQYSRVTNLTAVIGIDTNVAGAPLLIGFFEEGGEKLPSRGPDLAVPITGQPERPSFGASIPSTLQYQNLLIQQGKGKKHTFVVPGIGVFQRIGPYGRVWNKTTKRMETVNKAATQILYAFKASAPLHQRTQIIAVSKQVIEDRFGAIFNKAFVEELIG
jgi:hypothetical protein